MECISNVKREEKYVNVYQKMDEDEMSLSEVKSSRMATEGDISKKRMGVGEAEKEHAEDGETCHEEDE